MRRGYQPRGRVPKNPTPPHIGSAAVHPSPHQCHPALHVYDGQILRLAVCETCAMVRAFEDRPRSQFPRSGYWVECLVCHTYRFFYLLHGVAELQKG